MERERKQATSRGDVCCWAEAREASKALTAVSTTLSHHHLLRGWQLFWGWKAIIFFLMVVQFHIKSWEHDNRPSATSGEWVAACAQLSNSCSSPGGTGVQEEEEEEGGKGAGKERRGEGLLDIACGTWLSVLMRLKQYDDHLVIMWYRLKYPETGGEKVVKRIWKICL